MFGKRLLALLVPMTLALVLAGCDDSSNATRPGVVNTAAPGGSFRGETGRVMAIREVPIKGNQSGASSGTLVGGGLGAATGAVIGGLIGAIGGAIAGTAIDRNSTRRGIAVTVQKDDGSSVTIAQPDDGDVQMGDRVVIVYDRNGVAKAVRDTGYRKD